MKSSLTTVALALLSTAFLVSCQDLGSGPVGPDGLEPLFHAAHADCTGHKKNDMGCDRTPPDDFLYSITMEEDDGTIFIDPNASLPEGNENVVFRGITLDLDFLAQGGWMSGTNCPMGKATGILGLLEGDNTDAQALNFSFEQEGTGITHILWMEGRSTEPFPPASGDTYTMSARDGGHWFVISKGRGHKNACLGEGGGGVNEVSWTLTLTGL